MGAKVRTFVVTGYELNIVAFVRWFYYCERKYFPLGEDIPTNTKIFLKNK